MDVVTYKKHKIHTVIVPKGTLLFRAVVNPSDDFTGAKVGNMKCIPPQYNVFFYMNPFVTESQPEWYSMIKDIEVYELSQDARVVLLLKPSTHTRGDSRRLTKKSFLIPCNKTRKACLKGRPYDPCFEEGFLKKFPDIVGYIGIGRNDAIQLQKSLKTSLRDVVKYVQLTSDSRGVEGSPELVLYPLQTRVFKDIYIENPSEWKKQQTFNYKHITTIPRNHDDFISFIKQHTVQDPNTKYFSYKL